jgi:hypothetical protein
MEDKAIPPGHRSGRVSSAAHIANEVQPSLCVV